MLNISQAAHRHGRVGLADNVAPGNEPTFRDDPMGKMIQIKSSDGHALAAYCAEPAGVPRGAVVVVQEIWGVNRHIRDVADGYAADGYLAIAPAVFDRVEPGVMMDEYTPETRQRGFGIMQKLDLGKTMFDIDAAVRAVSSAGKVGVVGYCLGGRIAWLSAARVGGVAASVAYYGGGIPSLASEQPKCPVILHFGERDTHIPMVSVDEFRKAHPELPVYIYQADHGFNCDHRESFDAAASQLARERTLAFFREHLG